MPKSPADNGLKQKTRPQPIREYPCDEMHSEHHQQRCEVQALHPLSNSQQEVRHASKSPSCHGKILGGTQKCWRGRLAFKMRRKDKFFLQTQNFRD